MPRFDDRYAFTVSAYKCYVNKCSRVQILALYTNIYGCIRIIRIQSCVYPQLGTSLTFVLLRRNIETTVHRVVCSIITFALFK